jgi:plasmid stabilization system protein ParE
VNLRVHEAAEKELLDGAKWYEKRQRDLGEQLVDEYQAAILRILAAPTSYPKVETARTRRDIRRCVLKRFPYYVAYELCADEIVILAVAHAKRRPNYWIRRR